MLEQAHTYPYTLGEGKLPGALENNILYYLGLAYEGLGQADQARDCFRQASVGLSEPTSAMYYNDQPPHMIFYQGLALEKLGREDPEAARTSREVFEKLVRYGQQHLNDTVKMDYFAVSLPDFLVFEDDLSRRNRIHCYYMMALGYLGLKDTARASEAFERVFSLNADHIGAHLHQRLAA